MKIPRLLSALGIIMLSMSLLAGVTFAVAPSPKPSAATPGSSGSPKTVKLDLKEFAFMPNHLTVSPGDTIRLDNVGRIPHNFAVEGYNDKNPIQLPLPNEPENWPVPKDLKPGTYTFYCAYPGHRAEGMVGKLTVVAGASATPGAATPGVSASPSASVRPSGSARASGSARPSGSGG